MFDYTGFVNYRGIQRLVKTKDGPDFNSIQGLVEHSLHKLFRYPLSITISSRTDTGVHALETTGHVDIGDGKLFKLRTGKLLNAEAK